MVILFHLKIDSVPKIDDSSHFSVLLALLTLLLNLKGNSKCLSDQNWLVSTSPDTPRAAREHAVFGQYYTQEFISYLCKDIIAIFHSII